MYEGSKESFYINELKAALDGFGKVDQEMDRVSEEKRKCSRLVKNLLSVVQLRLGEKETETLLDRFELSDMARPFLLSDLTGTSGKTRRRRGRRKEIDPSEVLQKGTRVKMLSGNYNGISGIVSSSQARQGRKGLDVTYFLSLVDNRGNRKRTSVKHGTLSKTWIVLS